MYNIIPLEVYLQLCVCVPTWKSLEEYTLTGLDAELSLGCVNRDNILLSAIHLHFLLLACAHLFLL